MYLGLDGTRRMRRTETLWLVAEIIWKLLLGLLVIVLTLSMYSVSHGAFETTCVSLLILLFVRVSILTSTSYVLFLEQEQRASRHVLSIAKLLGHRRVPAEQRVLQRTSNVLERTRLMVMVRQGIYFVIGAMALW